MTYQPCRMIPEVVSARALQLTKLKEFLCSRGCHEYASAGADFGRAQLTVSSIYQIVEGVVVAIECDFVISLRQPSQ